MATSCMTTFSYACSAICKENMREPLLLAGFIKGWGPNVTSENSKAIGWTGHYTMGAGWAFVLYRALVSPSSRKVTLKPLASTLSGLVAVLIWHQLFLSIPNKSKTDKRIFYPHLILAHWVYTYSLAYSLKRCKLV